MFDLIKKHRAAIICSIIASLVVIYAVGPLLDLTIRVFSSIASLVGTAYVDRLYANSATMESTDSAFFLSVIIVFIPFSIVAIVGLVISTKKVFKRTPTSTIDTDIEVTQSKTAETDGSAPKRRSSIIATRVKASLLALFFFFFLILTLDIVSSKQFQWVVTTTFQHHIRTLRPYMDDDTEDKIISDWSLMNSQKDYDLIVKKLQSIAEKNGIDLPKNRMKRF